MEVKLISRGSPTKFNQLRPGLFLFNGTLCFKSEYGDDAYVVESEEKFHGRVSRNERGSLMVQPQCRKKLMNNSRKELMALIKKLKEQNPDAKIELFLCRDGLDFALNQALTNRVIVGAVHGEIAIRRRLEGYIEKIDRGNKSPNRIVIVENVRALKGNSHILLLMKYLFSIVRKSGMAIISVNDSDESSEVPEMGRVLQFSRTVQ